MRVVLAISLLLVGVSAITRKLYAPKETLYAQVVGKASARADGATFAQVNNIGNYTSFAGFFQVNSATDNNLFGWYFPAQNGNTSAPILIWLQGGPGGASTFGLFSEIGPFTLDENLNLVARDSPSTWNQEFGLLFIDNPVGAGFSYTGTGTGYATNQSAVANDLYAFMQQFYDYFGNLRSNDLYLTGESFAGHYIPAFGAKIYQENLVAPPSKIINLKGVSIGDGWTDPEYQLAMYADLLYNIGFASDQQRDQFASYQASAIAAIQSGDLEGAFKIWDEMLNGDIFPYGSYFFNVTGSSNYDNFLTLQSPDSFGYYAKYLTQDNIRSAIHVGNAPLNDGRQCELHLMADVMRSYKDDLGLLMDNYKVLLFNGQLDIIVGGPLTEHYLPTVNWRGAAGFAQTPRKIWRPAAGSPDIYGYVQQYQSFTYAIIRNAGHIAPYDAPDASLDLITRFVHDTPFPTK